jgi:GNAT superfamily N-acetyltransferase
VSAFADASPSLSVFICVHPWSNAVFRVTAERPQFREPVGSVFRPHLSASIFLPLWFCAAQLVLCPSRRLRFIMNFSIKPITPPELPELLELIRELARFEKLENEVQATGESLNEAFFGTHPAAGGLLARRDAESAGYAIFFFTFSSFVGRRGIWLEDVYVRPKFRQQGLGRSLIEAVARVGAQQNCGRFEWTALNWNKNALEFYQRLGARALDEWVLFRLNADGLKRLAG